MLSRLLLSTLCSAFLGACSPNESDETFKTSKRGVYFFALNSFSEGQCTSALSVFDGVENPRLGVLWGTFGDDMTCLERFLAGFPGRPKTLKVIIHNETCRRAPRYCEPFREIAADLDIEWLNIELSVLTTRIQDELRDRVQGIQGTVYPMLDELTTLEFMTALEHNFTEQAARNHTAIIAGEVRGERIIINPVDHRFGALRLGDAIELHGLTASFAPGVACSWSNDGIDIDFGRGSRMGTVSEWNHVRGRAEHYEALGCDVWLWWNTQGITENFVAPSHREFEVNDSDISQVNEWLRR